MNKVYQRINWENDKAPAINESNLNRMDYALDEIDTRVVKFSRQKDAMEAATNNANTATANANKATENANKAADSANAAATSANTAAANANEAAQAVLDEKYILTATTEMVRSGTARPTAKGNALLEKLTGSSWQRKLTGKNKFDIETMLTSNATRASEYFVTNTDIQSICNIPVTAGEKYTITAYIKTPVPNESYPERLRLSVQDGKNVGYTTSNKSIAFAVSLNTEWQLTVLRFTAVSDWISISSLGLIRNDMQIELGEASTDYEPYCGATPSPNPEFQQTIRSTGDMGWFDGEWLQGYYVVKTGEYNNTSDVNMRCVCNKNSIPCNSSDTVKIKYENIVSSLNVIFYDSNNSYISGSYADNASEYEVVAPINAKYFNFYIAVVSGATITPSTVGHVCVTINGKYAVIVDEVGKNLSPINNVTAEANTDVLYHNIGNKKKGVYTFSMETTATSGGIALKLLDANKKPILTLTKSNIDFNTRNSIILNADNDFSYVYLYTNTACEFKNIQLEAGGNATPYTPHHHNRIYIPLDEPLRAIGDVKDELVPADGWYKVLRRIKEIIIDNSRTYGSDNYYQKPRYYIETSEMPKLSDYTDSIISDKLTTVSQHMFDIDTAISGYYDSYGNYPNRNWIYFWSSQWETVDDLKNYLQVNSIIVQYKLATPYYEDLDQTPFYNIQSFDEVTHVSIAGLHEELEPTLTMRFPRHEDGALVTTSYCNSKKEAIERKAEMEEIKAAVLALSQS